ncbi:MAG: DNA repair protein RecO [Firmicutes bacterium]|nr:DNA repair protein RecO [Bacillota bacterium]
MHGETEGIVFRQLPIAGGKRMMLLFTREYGKISAGTSMPQSGGKGKAGLALRPFVLGKYRLNTKGAYYYLNGAETLESHFSLGENVDKFLCASYVMELTEKVLPENQPAPEIFDLLCQFLGALERRPKRFSILAVAYQCKLLQLTGSGPQLFSCVRCGNEAETGLFHVKEGGLLCKNCISEEESKEHLHFGGRFDIIAMLKYLTGIPMSKIEKMDAAEEALTALRSLLERYFAYHLEIRDLKSGSLWQGDPR